MEASSFLFKENSAFVPYGPGQYTESPSIEAALNGDHEHESGRGR
jgi:hypothetical protein